MIMYFAVLAMLMIAAFSSSIVPWLTKYVSKEIAATVVAAGYILGCVFLGYTISLPLAILVALVIILVHYSRFSMLENKNVVNFISGIDSKGIENRSAYKQSLAKSVFS